MSNKFYEENLTQLERILIYNKIRELQIIIYHKFISKMDIISAITDKQCFSVYALMMDKSRQSVQSELTIDFYSNDYDLIHADVSDVSIFEKIKSIKIFDHYHKYKIPLILYEYVCIFLNKTEGIKFIESDFNNICLYELILDLSFNHFADSKSNIPIFNKRAKAYNITSVYGSIEQPNKKIIKDLAPIYSYENYFNQFNRNNYSILMRSIDSIIKLLNNHAWRIGYHGPSSSEYMV